MMNRRERERFDAILEEELDRLPQHLHSLLEEAPLIVEDRPSRAILEELGLDPEDDLLCGLHTGVPLTERSVEAPHMEYMHLFREGILEHAGGWEPEANLRKEIRITLLHEIGHHFGLEDEDLDELGYG